METKRMNISDVYAEKTPLEEAAKILRNGGLVAFPTETVYGLGANGLDEKAASKIYAAKGRPSDNPLILHICDEEMLYRLVKNVSDDARRLAKAFWPGPMTLVLERRVVVPDRVTGGLETVGIRMPNHEIALALIEKAGFPLAAPSANISGRPSPTTAEMVWCDLAGKIDLIIDGGSCSCGVESTIIDCTEKVPTVLRPGAITLAMIEQVTGEVRLDRALAKQSEGVPKAPGMKYTHYAPKAPMTMLVGDAANMCDAMMAEIEKAVSKGQKSAVIVSAELAAELPPQVEKAVYGKRNDTAEIASNLYAALRKFDDSGVDVIFAEGTHEEGMGMAVMNRLQKACGYRIISVPR